MKNSLDSDDWIDLGSYSPDHLYASKQAEDVFRYSFPSITDSYYRFLFFLGNHCDPLYRRFR